MAANDLGPWEPMTPQAAALELAALAAPWWIGGGWSLDLLIGRQTRDHGDLDVQILRRDQHAVRQHLGGWDVHAADPPGVLRPWPIGETLPAHVHDVWCRRLPGEPWAFQLMIADSDGDDWVYRRDHRIRRPIASLSGRASSTGMAVLAPEVQLLYTSKGMREKDLADFASVLPHLTVDERSWLRAALETVSPDHPWLDRL